MNNASYSEFLKTKRVAVEPVGFEVDISDIELKASYYKVACQNLETAEIAKANEGLDLFGKR